MFFELTNDFMSFMITNESGYEMSYNFLFSIEYIFILKLKVTIKIIIKKLIIFFIF